MASIRKLPDGRWQAQYRPIPGGKQITRTTHKKADGQRWLDEQMASVVTGHYVDPSAGRITFGAYFEQWAARQVWVPGTVYSMNIAARSTIFWDVPLRLLRRSHIEEWVKAMQTTHRGNGRGKSSKTGLEPSTIATRFVNVRTVLRAAVADKRLVADPSIGVKLPRTRRREAAMRLPTVEEVRALMEAADAYFRPFIALCAFAGLRLGEAAALQADDIDFSKLTLNVSRQVQRAGGDKVEIRAPKYGSEREVHLPADLAGMLRQHVQNRPVSDEVGPWLFKGDNGNPPHQNTVGYWWRKTKRKAEVVGVRLHDLRHFFASGLIASGCDVVTVQRALGHSSPTVTLDTYAHLWPNAENRTRQAAASMLADVLRQSDERLTNGNAA